MTERAGMGHIPAHVWEGLNECGKHYLALAYQARLVVETKPE